MGPPGAIAGGVRVAGLVRLLMVQPVRGDPEDRPAFQRQGAANGKEVLQKPRYLIRAMGVQAMVTHADAEADGHPVQKNGHGEDAPTEHEKRGNGSDVQQNQYDSGKPVELLAVRTG